MNAILNTIARLEEKKAIGTITLEDEIALLKLIELMEKFYN